MNGLQRRGPKQSACAMTPRQETILARTSFKMQRLVRRAVPLQSGHSN